MPAASSLELSRGAVDFIDEDELTRLAGLPAPESSRVRGIIARSLDKQALTVEEAAALVRTTDPELVEEIFEAARTLKRTVYGNRIVLFAP
ncbi:MAG: [FeFe] hydrogenase H-cluster radical SAM maturase HydG, partial [Candidatus Glassbacteria bacterium]|nr:[FeFe] hydrogenase H-cluster radical SAM maturase HydG [Candidatus Glassbacteria bacterium]